jgi:colanic acid/amylovoran biosynthesis glycosyltransferase
MSAERDQSNPRIKVLHSAGTYLHVTENWIAPQVFAVPGVQGRVLCDARINAEQFPVAPEDVIVDPPSAAWPGVLRHRWSQWARRQGRHRYRSELRVRRWQPHLIHAHFGTRGWQTMRLADRLRIPLVVSFYGWDAWMAPRQSVEWVDRYRGLFRQSRAFLVEGPAMRDRLVSLGCQEDRVIVHHIGVNVESLAFVPRRFSGALNVLMVGRFVEKKGLADGLRACARARQRGVDLRVTIIGGAAEGDAAGAAIGEELQRITDDQLTGLVRFTGFLSAAETNALLAAHDVLLCPSRHAANGDAEGGSPVILTEAMAQGLFCIGTRHCDIPEVIHHRATGLLADERDVEGLAEALHTVARDPSAAAALTSRGRAHVEESFSLRLQLQRLRDVYASILSERAAPISRVQEPRNLRP